jgi:hypothetical protein
MLSGALIGACVGLVIALVQLAQRSSGYKRLITALETQGREMARAAIDRNQRGVIDLRAEKVLEQRERMAALAVVGDLPSLREEIQTHRGKIVVLARVNGMALLGLALREQGEARAQAVTKLDELAAKLEAEGGALSKIPKKELHALAALGHALLGQPIKVDDQLPLHNLTSEKSAVGLLVAQALSLGLAATGVTAKAEEYAALVRSRSPKAFQAQAS